MSGSMSLSRKFNDRLISEIGDPLLYAPSMKLSVLHKGKVAFQWACGEDHLYYDLASLTKILFSAPLWMRLIRDGKCGVDDPVQTYLPWWVDANSVTVRGLLTHTAGLDWWKPYYNFIGQGLSHEAGWSKLRSLLSKERPSDSQVKKAVYSDLDLFYLGFLAEELSGKNLLSMWKDVADQMNYQTLHFQVDNHLAYKKSLYAPTGFSAFRERELCGEVHDDNAFFLGGVAPHAGLFGTLADVESYLLTLRKILKTGKAFGFEEKDLSSFVQRQMPQSVGDFGYIFWKPTPGASSSGRYFDDSSFGHLGFTGTSLWYSPKKDLGVILLSNRVYYGSDVEFFRHFRPLVHDLVGELLLD